MCAGQTTPYLQPVTDLTLPTVWSQLLSACNYEQRVASVAAFNQANRWRKRGIAVVPTKVGAQRSQVRH